MSDYTIRGVFDVEAEPADVKQWLDSTEGIAGWWSDTVSGNADTRGGIFHVTFPDTPMVFDLEVTELTDSVTEWHIDENPPWWKDTTIRFEILPSEGGGTNLMFSHAGFEPDDPIIPVITPAWVRFVDNLAAVSASGAANPAVRN